MTNGTEEKVEAAEVEATPFVGGEIHIIADGKTGGIQIKSPPNLLVCLGILETAKVILTQQHIENMKQQAASRPPAIMKASPADLKGLPKVGERQS